MTVRILDRYLFREFLVSFVAVLAFCSLLLTIAIVFDKFQDIVDNETPVDKALLYLLYVLPFRIVQTVPLATMLAVLFSVGGMARNNEVVAMITSGIPTLRLAVPVLAGGLIVLIGTFFVNELLAPVFNQRARYIDLRYIENQEESRITSERNVFARGRDNRFYVMPYYSLTDATMYFPQIMDVTPEFTGLRQRIEATSARHVPSTAAAFDSGETTGTEWVLTNARIWSFDADGRIVAFENRPGESRMVFEDNLTAVLEQSKQPEEMNFSELREFVNILQQRKARVFQYQTELVFKITFPLGMLAVMMVGFSFAVRSRPGTAVAAFGYGVFWALVYYAASILFQTLGRTGNLSPVISGLLPLIMFAAFSVYMVRRSARWHA